MSEGQSWPQLLTELQHPQVPARTAFIRDQGRSEHWLIKFTKMKQKGTANALEYENKF